MNKIKINRRSFLKLAAVGGVSLASWRLAGKTGDVSQLSLGSQPDEQIKVLLGEIQAKQANLASLQCVLVKAFSNTIPSIDQETFETFNADVIYKAPQKLRMIYHNPECDIIVLRDGNHEIQQITQKNRTGAPVKTIESKQAVAPILTSFGQLLPPSCATIGKTEGATIELVYESPKGIREVFVVDKRNLRIVKLDSYNSNGSHSKRVMIKTFYPDNSLALATKIEIERYDLNGMIKEGSILQLQNVIVNATISDEMFKI